MNSADTIGGWENHYRRMRRWEERSLRLLSDLPVTDFREAIDMSLAYFLWCHSLREWLINDNAIDTSSLDAELANYPIWRLCRDVANRTRHLDLTHRPTDKDWSAYREYEPFSVQIDGRERHVANFRFDGRKVRVGEAILEASSMWADIIQRSGVSQSIP